MGKLWVHSNKKLQVRIVQFPREKPLLQRLEEGFRNLKRLLLVNLEEELIHSHLFKKLICKFAHKWVTVFRVAVNEVDESTTVRIFGASTKLTNEDVVRPYLWSLLHKHSSFASAVSTH